MVGGQRSGAVLGHFPIKGESFLAVYVERLTMEVSLGTREKRNNYIGLGTDV